jgi:hypothetical protein
MVGLVAYLAIAVKASLLYGGAAAVAIAHGLGFEEPETSVFSRLVVWVGMLLGALSTAAVIIVIGAVLGALVRGVVVSMRKGESS